VKFTKTPGSLFRKSHLLGAKLRTLRKRNGFTLEELSARCMQINAQTAPSESYLSMIEGGKRFPSQDVMQLLSGVFQRDIAWLLDDNAELQGCEDAAAGADTGTAAATTRLFPLEPAFLFSKKLLQGAIPELLAQTGTTGRQFAHLLIRSHQEQSQNNFPDLEHAAEDIGARQFPLGVSDLTKMCKKHGLALRWFDRPPVLTRDEDREVRSVVRSFFEAPRTIYLNRELQSDAARLKFDLATHLGHKLLHSGDGLKAVHATGGEMGASPESGIDTAAGLSPQEVMRAWRDFECSFFAGALLCPKIPFRRFLARERYRVEAGRKIQLTPAVVMRRMTKVSPYPHWHFFDAYPPGYLRAVYRGNGIPLPWGNMAQATDPCPHWAVFRMLNERRERSSQISVLRDGQRSMLYCCHSVRAHDMARNPHVLSVGIDLAPALRANGFDAAHILEVVAKECAHQGGHATIPAGASAAIQAVSRVLNIAWLEDALDSPATIICPRSTNCQRHKSCTGGLPSRAREIADVRKEIISQSVKH
jgi:transcriptional regulator with XRE-family HTH domain/predicted transcriptional regulator